jgi:1,4-dihydroxy-2-naphthoate octaprenyltransferase
VLLVLTGSLGWGVLLVLFALPRLKRVLQVYAEPKPAAPPAGFRIWPLWYVAAAFYHNKLAGGLFVLGLIVNLVLA